MDVSICRLRRRRLRGGKDRHSLFLSLPLSEGSLERIAGDLCQSADWLAEHNKSILACNKRLPFVDVGRPTTKTGSDDPRAKDFLRLSLELGQVNHIQSESKGGRESHKRSTKVGQQREDEQVIC